MQFIQFLSVCFSKMYWVDSGLEHLVQANYNGTEATIIADFSNDRTISNDALGEVPVTFDEKGKHLPYLFKILFINSFPL